MQSWLEGLIDLGERGDRFWLAGLKNARRLKRRRHMDRLRRMLGVLGDAPNETVYFGWVKGDEIQRRH